MPVNIMTVDLEDWPHSTLDRALPITSRIVASTKRLMNIMEDYKIKATFFVLGKVAKAYPDLVREIDNAGHEIASHGFNHEPIFNLTPAEFSDDIEKAGDIIENITGKKVIGYRAPDFSIVKKTLWALDIIADYGMKYDSSIFPIRGRRYGIAEALRTPNRINDKLYEVPLSTIRVGGINLPVCGGGYFRMFPYWVTKQAIRRINDEENPAVVYIHPYELDSEELKNCGMKIPLSLYLSQGFGRKRMERKLKALFTDFEFKPIREVAVFDE